VKHFLRAEELYVGDGSWGAWRGRLDLCVGATPGGPLMPNAIISAWQYCYGSHCLLSLRKAVQVIRIHHILQLLVKAQSRPLSSAGPRLLPSSTGSAPEGQHS